MSVWQFYALGPPRLELGASSPAVERKSAAVLTYLALDGPTSRSRLAGLLWPDSVEATARNNLSQLLRRFRQAAGAALVVGEDPLRLSPELRVDVAELKVRAFSGDAQAVVAYSGELLEGLDFDALPEFADWLHAEREALKELHRQALETLLGRAEKAGQYERALPYAEALVAHDEVAEGAYRALMRLHYLTGNRPAALKVYRRCQAVLARELSVEPLPETRALAQKIEAGELPPAAARRAEAQLPLEVLRPPTLIGREEAWRKMEAAWARGQTIYLAGEPGVGKTRLAQAFVASKGKGLYLPARPGHQDVPLAAAVSLARTRLAEAPEVRLPAWVLRELSRILPELRPDDAPDAPQLRGAGEEERLRFFQAYFEMVRLTGADVVATISDDVQYYDPVTVELGSFMMSQPRSPTAGQNIPRYLVVYRRGDLSPAAQASVDRLVAAELAVVVDVAPFSLAETASLLNSLQLEALGDEETASLADTVHRRTGGNALFILETLRHLLETGTEGGLAFPAGSKVDAIIRQRLARLSPAAQRVVKAAAVLQSDFDLELVAAVLGTDPLDLLEPWEELEHAQVFAGSRFSHDLLYETALSAVSQPVRVLLNRRSAEALEARAASPARVAKHWLAAGDELAAVPALRQAAARALRELRFEDAAQVFDQVSEMLARQGRTAELAEVLAEKHQGLTAKTN